MGTWVVGYCTGYWVQGVGTGTGYWVWYSTGPVLGPVLGPGTGLGTGPGPLALVP